MKNHFLLLALGALGLHAHAQQDGIYRDLTLAAQEPEKVVTLDLSNSNLTYLSPEIKKFKNLEGIFLQNNELKVLPSWLSENLNLKRIIVDNNPQLNLSASLNAINGPELIYISAANCNLLAIPLPLQKHPSIVSLNLSQNYIREIPFHLQKLVNLRNLDLSTNQIEFISSSFWNCQSLSSIDLSDNEKLQNDTALLVLSAFNNLNCVKLSDLNKSTMLADIETKKMILDNCTANESFPGSDLNVTELCLSNATIRDVNFFDKLSKNTSIKKLTLVNCRVEINSAQIEKCKNLQSIELNNTNMTNYKLLYEMTGLKELKIKKQPLSAQQLADLKQQLAQTNIQADFASEYPFARGPVQDITVPSTTTIINTAVKTEFKTENVKLIIPENAFVDEEGKVVTGNVELNYREFFDPISIAFSGINMRVDTNVNGAFMASAGMFEINMKKDGKEVFPNPAAEIKAEFTPAQTGDGFKQFSSNNNEPWKVDNAMVSFVRNRIPFNYPMPVSPPDIFFEQLYFELDGNPNNFTFTIRKYTNNSYNWNYRNRKRMTFIEYPETKVTKKYNLRYRGENSKYHFKQLDSINRQVSGKANWDPNSSRILPNYIEDLAFVPDFKEDVIVMKFKFHGRPYEIPFVINEENLSNQKVQERTKEFYTTVTRAGKDNPKRKQAIETYEWRFEQYTKELEKMQKFADSVGMQAYTLQRSQDSTVAALGLRSAQLKYYRAQFRVRSPGMHNCDKIITIPNTNIEPLMAKVSLESSDEKPSLMLLVDKTNNTCVSFYPYQQINYDKRSQYSIIAVYPGSKIGVCSEEEFNNAKKQQELILRAINTKDKTLDQIRAEI
ncbi:MAG TPA: leucine-rich repeat domain-containing protein [Flavobacteriales bacterium]|nr:leucine-rich repeat domain-containing protein [Flavobacteriales bacterium]